jgi:hypothetical protein
MSDEWANVCVLCAARNRQTRLKFGHCCAWCADRIMQDIRDIPALAAMAHASLMPGQGSGSMSVVYGPKEPVRLEALDPELAPVVMFDGEEDPQSVLQNCESWEKLIRDSRGMPPYGPVSAHRATVSAREGLGGWNDTGVTLTGVCAFLASQVEYAVSEPDFPLEDFADEMQRTVRVLKHWDVERQDGTAYVVECPADVDGATCGKRIRIAGEDSEAYFHCPRCSTEWSVDRLMLVWAETNDAAMYLDAEAIVRRYGIDRATLARWVAKGRITKWHGLYDIRPLALAQRRGA